MSHLPSPLWFASHVLSHMCPTSSLSSLCHTGSTCFTFPHFSNVSSRVLDSYGMPCRLELYVAPIHRWYHTSDLVCLCHVEFLFWNRSRRGFLGPSENISENYNTVMGIFFPIKEFTIKIEGYFWLGTAWQHIYILVSALVIIWSLCQPLFTVRSLKKIL